MTKFLHKDNNLVLTDENGNATIGNKEQLKNVAEQERPGVERLSLGLFIPLDKKVTVKNVSTIKIDTKDSDIEEDNYNILKNGRIIYSGLTKIEAENYLSSIFTEISNSDFPNDDVYQIDRAVTYNTFFQKEDKLEVVMPEVSISNLDLSNFSSAELVILRSLIEETLEIRKMPLPKGHPLPKKEAPLPPLADTENKF